MARRKASRLGYAKAAGAVLIAFALFGAISLVPQQSAHAPQVFAQRLAEGVGVGAVLLPALCLIIGLTLFVQATFRVTPRVWGLVLGYVVGLLVLHVPYGPGREFLAAAERKGGGYLGAGLVVTLRRFVGEPGLWAVVFVGGIATVLLTSGVSLTDALRALLQACRVGGIALTSAGRHLGRVVLLGGIRAAAQIARTAMVPREALEARPFGAGVLTRSSPAAPQVEALERHIDASAGSPDMAWRTTGSEPHAEASLVPETPDLDHGDDVAAFEAPRARSGRKKPVAAQETLVFPGRPSRTYTLPDLSLLEQFPAGKVRSGKVDPEEVARSLERTLASFGVDARVVRWETGPVVTRYELQPAPGVKVQKITSLQNDIALALAASSVRLEAPIPGKSAIGVELPNERPGLVHLREILISEEFQTSPSPLTVAVGKAITGTAVVADVVTMPHVLIAGTTGAGKSVAINSMIASILFRATPEHVRLLMIDPKRVELTNYNGIPHLLSPVVTAPREAAAKLRWAISEMESRYEMFAADGVRNIQSFNAQHPDRPLAYILIIIDELADLMMIAPADFEEIICRLAQMTRAVGIHLLIATQRPSVDVITGLIKANIPSRIAFSVSSQVDSRTILDHPGAEKLLGRGDMLFSPIGAVRPTRVQGAYISDGETERLVEFWRAQGEAAYVEDLVQASGDAADESGSDDVLLGDAARLIVRAGYASVSLLQRKMRIGYVRAARVVDQLEEKGIVGPAQGSSPRDVLVGLDDLERILQRGVARGARGARALDEADAE